MIKIILKNRESEMIGSTEHRIDEYEVFIGENDEPAYAVYRLAHDEDVSYDVDTIDEEMPRINFVHYRGDTRRRMDRFNIDIPAAKDMTLDEMQEHLSRQQMALETATKLTEKFLRAC